MNFYALGKALREGYLRLHLLSLDTVFGACAGMYFFAELLKVKLDARYYLVLGLAVWVVYTLDHLMDARLAKGKVLTKRHRFHQEHFNALVIFLFPAIGFGLYLVLAELNSFNLLYLGFALAFLMILVRIVGMFFFSSLPFYKEVSIAFFYVAGISLAPLAFVDWGFLGFKWVFYWMVYWIIASFNLLFLAILDLDEDRSAAFISGPVLAGVRKTKILLKFLGVLGTVCLMSLFIFLPSFYHRFTLILLVIIMFHIRSFAEQTHDSQTVRKKLEAIFLLPSVLLLL